MGRAGPGMSGMCAWGDVQAHISSRRKRESQMIDGSEWGGGRTEAGGRVPCSEKGAAGREKRNKQSHLPSRATHGDRASSFRPGVLMRDTRFARA